jgi:hypothetical protein
MHCTYVPKLQFRAYQNHWRERRRYRRKRYSDCSLQRETRRSSSMICEVHKDGQDPYRGFPSATDCCRACLQRHHPLQPEQLRGSLSGDLPYTPHATHRITFRLFQSCFQICHVHHVYHDHDPRIIPSHVLLQPQRLSAWGPSRVSANCSCFRNWRMRAGVSFSLHNTVRPLALALTLLAIPLVLRIRYRHLS